MGGHEKACDWMAGADHASVSSGRFEAVKRPFSIDPFARRQSD
mgnify:FL=1